MLNQYMGVTPSTVQGVYGILAGGPSRGVVPPYTQKVWKTILDVREELAHQMSNEQKGPCLFRLYRGLYYPVMRGL